MPDAAVKSGYALRRPQPVQCLLTKDEEQQQSGRDEHEFVGPGEAAPMEGKGHR